MKSRPIPGRYASGGCLLMNLDDPKFRSHDGACGVCGKPLWMHDRERVYPDDGPTGSYHHRYVCEVA